MTEEFKDTPTGITIDKNGTLKLLVNNEYKIPEALTEGQSLQHFGKIVSLLNAQGFSNKDKNIMVGAAKILFEKASKDEQVKEELKDIVGHIGGILRDAAKIESQGNIFENFYRGLADLYQFCAKKVGIKTERIEAAGKLYDALDKYTDEERNGYAGKLKNSLQSRKEKNYGKAFHNNKAATKNGPEI